MHCLKWYWNMLVYVETLREFVKTFETCLTSQCPSVVINCCFCCYAFVIFLYSEDVGLCAGRTLDGGRRSLDDSYKHVSECSKLDGNVSSIFQNITNAPIVSTIDQNMSKRSNLFENWLQGSKMFQRTYTNTTIICVKQF